MDQIATTEFKFAPLYCPGCYVQTLASSMQHYPPERLLSATSLTWKRDLEEIQSMINCLTPKKMIVQLSAKSFESQAKEENWEKEPYYETRMWL